MIQQSKGVKKWTVMTTFIRNRTENSLRNRYNLLLGKMEKLKFSKGIHYYLTELEKLNYYIDDLVAKYPWLRN